MKEEEEEEEKGQDRTARLILLAHIDISCVL